ncbi:hypothetical protein FA15DRAFT_645464 [Coprinopsis marcescibilis]|uniref:Peptidase M43 pregnancy-associated plasma-A domain-containing protein n=1 Tax=Coprinopsis marcescibilis TaxID=230819 RepID=A0A5C3KM93_COPMA|nr:hypothetical protein FA15DRAFT_645464 [Coprinopsis marcescibilis]
MTCRECGSIATPDDFARQQAASDSVRRELEGQNDNAVTRRQTRDFVFPLHYHVIAQDTNFEDGFLQDSHVNDMVTLLNQGFANTGVRFELQEITRDVNRTWFQRADRDRGKAIEIEMKRKTRVGGANTLNIWTVGFFNPGAPAGYSSFPWDLERSEEDRARDGVVMKFDLLPSNPDGAPHRIGKTLTHEVGHWVGLFHTFENSTQCTGNGDFVDDTSLQKNPTGVLDGCVERNSCGAGLDPVDNFMDYSSDECRSKFTPNQITRMHEQLTRFRS